METSGLNIKYSCRHGVQDATLGRRLRSLRRYGRTERYETSEAPAASAQSRGVTNLTQASLLSVARACNMTGCRGKKPEKPPPAALPSSNRLPGALFQSNVVILDSNRAMASEELRGKGRKGKGRSKGRKGRVSRVFEPYVVQGCHWRASSLAQRSPVGSPPSHPSVPLWTWALKSRACCRGPGPVCSRRSWRWDRP